MIFLFLDDRSYNPYITKKQINMGMIKDTRDAEKEILRLSADIKTTGAAAAGGTCRCNYPHFRCAGCHLS